MTEEEFGQFRQLNNMYGRLVRSIQIKLPYCIIDVPQREPTKQYKRSPKVRNAWSSSACDRYWDDSSLWPRFKHEVHTDKINYDWNNLSLLLHSITTLYQSVISSETGWNVLADSGYIYEIYFRMWNASVWYMKLENRAETVRYNCFNE
jgi:hypothetical protein